MSGGKGGFYTMKTMKIVLLGIVLLAIAMLAPSPALI